MNYYALDEALDYINEGSMPLDFCIKEINQFTEDFEFVTEETSVKEKIKEAFKKLIEKIKAFFKKVGEMIKKAAMKIKTFVSSKVIDKIKNSKYKDLDIDTKECFKDKEAVKEASLPEVNQAKKIKLRIEEAIKPGKCLIKFDNYTDIKGFDNKINQFDIEKDKYDSYLIPCINVFLKSNFTGNSIITDRSKIMEEWKENIRKVGESKLANNMKLNVLVQYIYGTLQSNIKTLEEIQDFANELSECITNGKEELEEAAPGTEDWHTGKNLLNFFSASFGIVTMVTSTIAESIGSGNNAISYISYITNV